MAETDWLPSFSGDLLRLSLGIGAYDHVRDLCDGQVRATGIAITPLHLPTEEIFTLPHKDRVDGEVSSTKPLSYAGVLIDGIRVRFEAGKIVEASAKHGEEAFLRLLDTDEGARHIGEVALVPHKSPISSSGILFNNTLFDENAACHVIEAVIEYARRFFFAFGSGVLRDRPYNSP